MTQDVQPLTWQKRTNLEEHQQFFSKINEIIANLAPTVDEAEAAIAQATQAIASANQAIATANAASAAADAAAQQAQTAAGTVAGYNTRLTAAEGSITSLSGRMTSAESKNNQQDTAITALQTADTGNVKISRINEYAVGLTGNQKALGEKTGLFHGYRYIAPAAATNGKWLRYMSIPARYTLTMTEVVGTTANNGMCYAKAITAGTQNFLRVFSISNVEGISGIKVACAINQSTNRMEFWIYISVVNMVNGLVFYNLFGDDIPVVQAEYINTEHDALPTDGYTTFTYILGSA